MQPISEGRLLELLQKYDALMQECLEADEVFVGQFGLHVDHSRQLKALCLICARQCATPEEAANIVASYFGDAWLLNVDWTKAIGEFARGRGLPEFPMGFGGGEASRWQIACRSTKRLSELLKERIGICLSYSFTLGIVLKVTGLAEEVWLGTCAVGDAMHMVVLTEGPHCAFDLSHRAHTGELDFPNDVEIEGKFQL